MRIISRGEYWIALNDDGTDLARSHNLNLMKRTFPEAEVEEDE